MFFSCPVPRTFPALHSVKRALDILDTDLRSQKQPAFWSSNLLKIRSKICLRSSRYPSSCVFQTCVGSKFRKADKFPTSHQFVTIFNGFFSITCFKSLSPPLSEQQIKDICPFQLLTSAIHSHDTRCASFALSG